MKKNISHVFIPLAGILLMLGAGCSARPAAEQTGSAEPVSESIIIDGTEGYVDDGSDTVSIDASATADVEIKTPPPAEPEVKKEEPTPEIPATPSVPEPIVISITAKQWEFVPSTVTVKKGQKVTLNIASTDVDHGFALSEFGISKTLAAGLTTSVVFTADKTGTFPFFCSVFCGAGHGGMKGTLIVTE